MHLQSLNSVILAKYTVVVVVVTYNLILGLGVGVGVSALSSEPLFLLVLFDGFRWDYVDKFETPNFHSVINSGVRARHVLNIVPTVTMANHYTILTGTYAETHGIVANNFYDPIISDDFHMRDDNDQIDPKWFDTGVEPIWVTNQLNSSLRYSGSMLWPDALAPVKNIKPTYKVGPPLFDENISFESRIDIIIEWFLNKDKPINLGLLYFGDPDETGHQHGPNSKQMEEKVKELDELLGYLISKLKENQLFEILNMVITADHGMAEVLPGDYINISQFVSKDLYQDYDLSSMGLLNPKTGKEDIVYDKLVDMSKAHSVVKVYRKTDAFIKTLNYSENSRISPIIITIQKGFYLIKDNDQIKKTAAGLHGYLPWEEDMHPFFIAHGPAFKEGFLTESLRSIDFYELMCHLLNLTPAPNNGSLASIQHILKSPGRSSSELTNYTLVTYFCVGVFCALIAGVFIIGALRQPNSSRSRVISLDDVTLFDVRSKTGAQVPLLDEEDTDNTEAETFDL